MPKLSGTVTIPYITNYFSLGDQIQKIQGRNVLLQGQSPPALRARPTGKPTVVKIAWTLGEQQRDHAPSYLRAEPRG
jgi:hypothetical protein